MKNRNPSWVESSPCPAWCEGQHEHQEHPDDRQHYGFDVESFELSVDVGPAGDGKGTFAPRCVSVDLWQGYREIEPRVSLSEERDDNWLYFTLAEAEKLANGLLAAVRAARGETEALGGVA